MDPFIGTSAAGAFMQEDKWTSADIRNVFRFDARGKSLTSIFGAEERGDIPKAQRIMRGKVSTRQWSTADIPEIGKKLGFMTKLPEQEVICVYTAKGGVLKSSLAFALARLCALNGLKTVIVGLDIQCSITDLALPSPPITRLDESNNGFFNGIYQKFYTDKSITDILRPTPIPTLWVIPENPELNDLERRMRMEKRQEYIFKTRLMSDLASFDVVVFDNGPSWNILVENSLVVATTVVSPAGCDLGTHRALKTNLSRIHDFQNIMDLAWSNFIIVPTLLEKTNISQQIYGSYLSSYKERVLATPIRRAVKGQEAHVFQKSVMEYHPKARLSVDYYEMITELWSRIRQGQGDTIAA